MVFSMSRKLVMDDIKSSSAADKDSTFQDTKKDSGCLVCLVEMLGTSNPHA